MIPALETPPEDWEIEAAERFVSNLPALSYAAVHLRTYYGIKTSSGEIVKILEKFISSATFPIEFTERELEILEIIRRELLV